ncbi:hypothetical protein SeMB42_g07779 [Synchytrium endobioticum]|uniref:Uncharacterized protein n=1 Tax=Synchytrium endobioticum TaxID=286115 RepID=A0A507BZZ6_9FUNG|nr:hypothetical protein SeMB42_g07779 [Synchytrium endobioticum]
MRIKGVGHLMLLGGLFVSHVIGLPMNGHESHQGDVGIDIVTIPMPVNPMADEEKRKAEALERYDIVKEWLGTLIPKGLELGQPELVYTPAEEPFKVWKEQIGLANKLLNKLKERQKKRKGNPPFKAYDVIRKNNHMKQFCEALKPFLELMIEVLQYLKDRSKPVCKVFSRKASLANELWKTQEHLFKVQLSCLEILPNADDVTYAFIREFFATSLDKAIAAELEQNDKLTKKIKTILTRSDLPAHDAPLTMTNLALNHPRLTTIHRISRHVENILATGGRLDDRAELSKNEALKVTDLLTDNP